jgi:hypothetical protein
MPKSIDLTNQQIDVQQSKEIDQKASSGNGEPVIVDVWMFVFTDRTYGDQIRIRFRREARDEIVRKLTGVVIAGGELPKL